MLNAAQGFTYNKFQKPNDWPKIEDTFDYKYDNGKLIGGNKNLFLSGPVNYELVGNPTIVDGVLSDLSYSNYCQTVSNLAYNYNDNVKMQFKFKTPSSFTGNWANIVSWLSSNDPIISLYSMSSLNIRPLFYANKGQINIVYNFALNTEYVIELEGSSGEWTAKLIKNEVVVSTATLTTNSGSVNTPVFFGRKYRSTSSGISALDLKETYIKVNGNLWFYGKNYTTSNMVPVPAGLEYNNTTTPNIGWVYTNSDLVKGPVGYRVVGSPTIVDGVASGFSNSNYLVTTNSSIGTDYSSFEFLIKTRLDIIDGYINTILSGSGYQFIIQVDSEGYLRLFLSASGTTSWNISNGKKGTSTLTLNTYYWIKLLFNGTQYIFSVSTDGVEYNDEIVVSSSKKIEIPRICIGSRSHVVSDRYLRGSIDLNETYIKVNGQPWFGNVSRFQEFIPAPEEAQIGKDDTHNLVVETPIVNGELLSPKLVGPVGYTVVGSPTIVDGVVSGFSDNGYIRTSSTLDLITNHSDLWEFQVKFTTGDDISTYSRCIYSADSFYKTFIRNSDKKVHLLFRRYDGVEVGWNWKEPTLNYVVSTNTTYVLNAQQQTDELLVIKLYSSDGLLLATIQLEGYFSFVNTNSRVLYGRKGNETPVSWNGTIDFNQTYIKVNGALWFGKEDWTPSTYTDNAIYLLGSHNADYSTYNTQGINPTIETESDESGTYNIWIDNQEIYKEQSNPLDINWSNLALTTGYDITTPSTLKAHVIKVEPNNGNITRFSTDTNYKIENGLLTWASPKLYLEGPTQYTVVGNPTLVDCMASGFSTSDYLRISSSIDVTKPFEIFMKINTSDSNLLQNIVMLKGTSSVIAINATSHKPIFLMRYYGTDDLLHSTSATIQSGLENNTAYYLKGVCDTNGVSLSVSTDKTNWNTVTTPLPDDFVSWQVPSMVDLGGYDLYYFAGSIDLNETYIKVNNELWFGKIYTSETDVPVPANFTYGNTTTSSNGTVNLTTQEFSADTLATYGKDN